MMDTAADYVIMKNLDKPKKETPKGSKILMCMRCGAAVEYDYAYFLHLYHPKATSNGKVKYWHLCPACGESAEDLMEEIKNLQKQKQKEEVLF